MVDIAEIQRQSYITSVASRAGDGSGVEQDVVDRYSNTANKEAYPKLTPELGKTLGAIKSNFDMRLQALSAKFNVEMEKTQGENVDALVGEIAQSLRSEFPDKLAKAKNLFGTVNGDYGDVMLAIALKHYEARESDFDKRIVGATMSGFVSDIDSLSSQTDKNFTIKTFCVRALKGEIYTQIYKNGKPVVSA